MSRSPGSSAAVVLIKNWKAPAIRRQDITVASGSVALTCGPWIWGGGGSFGIGGVGGVVSISETPSVSCRTVMVYCAPRVLLADKLIVRSPAASAGWNWYKSHTRGIETDGMLIDLEKKLSGIEIICGCGDR